MLLIKWGEEIEVENNLEHYVVVSRGREESRREISLVAAGFRDLLL